MIKLRFPIEKSKFRFEQLEEYPRTKDWVILRKINLAYPDAPVSYEVVKIQKYKERKIGDKIIEAKEAMPGDEMWGRFGFTFMSVSLAVKEWRKHTGIPDARGRIIEDRDDLMVEVA